MVKKCQAIRTGRSGDRFSFAIERAVLLSLSIHAALRDLVAFLRAMRGLFVAAAAGFLALGPALTTDSNSCFGCFGVR